MRRSLLTAVVSVGLVITSLASPASVLACLCSGQAQGEVVFVGTATNGPASILGAFAPALVEGSGGTYTFTVDRVLRGDASDARVFTPPGAGECGRDFVIGATYEVHADHGDYWWGSHSFDAPLLTTICLQGSEVSPASALGFLSYRPSSLGLIVMAGLVGGLIVMRTFRGSATTTKPKELG